MKRKTLLCFLLFQLTTLFFCSPHYKSLPEILKASSLCYFSEDSYSIPHPNKNIYLDSKTFTKLSNSQLNNPYSNSDMTHNTNPSYILVTGGTGFIGSFTVLELIKHGYTPVVIDNLINSSTESLNRIKKLSNSTEDITFCKADLMDYESLKAVFEAYKFDGVIHTTALKSVGESVAQPLRYYENNIGSTLNILKLMKEYHVKNIVFSSSATVYKTNENGEKLKEDGELGCINPYGRTKLFGESIIRDMVEAESGWNAVILRYFNPTGAHPSGIMGEDPTKIPNNLMPYVSQVAVGKLEKVHVFGNDYNTLDGTGVRDYIHVVDLAEAHVLSLSKIKSSGNTSEKGHFYVYNLGSGTGYSVLQIINAMSKACGREIPYVIDGRRKGDPATVVCDPSLAEKELGFKAKLGLDEMCRDLWKWQSMNPNGYN
ncbi:hypothetical protein BB559_002545 [Furculomyces boomerangus]|uniref:NAD(P)-binding domain-containing protein n=2 Tax=Harpellales TaxID=61421 RepID=A0A2T9YUD0_9FUNG|nr:hypothetical protein BB559_002545 [Furculomyces boomerangus]PWA01320.1 hypothetical protein BB558_002593 [Smittium angustum]